MSGSETFRKYANLLADLKSLVEETEKRVLRAEPDPLFVQNANFFVKSYLITLCTYLEAFQQEKALEFIQRIDAKIRTIAVPRNVIRWSIAQEVKDKDLSFERFSLGISREKVFDELSGNPRKTMTLFKLLGVDLRSNPHFEGAKDAVFSVVSKRNRIIHHNDDASDVTLGDIKTWCQTFAEYSLAIDKCVDSHFP